VKTSELAGCYGLEPLNSDQHIMWMVFVAADNGYSLTAAA